MDKPKQGATAKARSKRREKKIRALPGKNNILVIAPHGRFHDDDYTNIIAEELSEVFGCYAVINEKYRRPRKKKKERRDPHKLILDLNLIEDAKLVAGNEYLDKIDEYSKTIANSDDPIVFYIHGIKKENIERAARISKDYKGEPGDLQILVGYGQKGVKNPPFTAEEKTVTALIKGLEAPPGSFAVIRAPLDDIPVDNEKKSYCGNSPRGMNQYFAQNGIAVQSIQLEIRNKGLREDPVNARETAGFIGKAISALIVEIEKPGEREGWTTLSKKPEMKQIRVGEIDLNDKKFIIRTPELWFDEEKMDWLASTIKAGGIHQNIIVRRTPGRDGYQIISGFRRLRALQKVMQEDGGENKFEDQEIWAEVYDHSLSDEEAFRVSLSENLAREDLSAWEIAKSLRTIREELGKNGKTPGAIVKRLAGMINKKPKTVARFLQIGTIENEDLRKAIHKGEVDFSTALVFAREEFTEDDRAALYGFYKGQSISFNQFNSYVKNLLELRKSLGITVSEILDLPMARTLLETDPKELKEKAGELEETQGESPQEILKTIADGVKIPDAGTPSRAEYSQFVKRFSKKAEPIERKINRHLAGDNLPAKFSLKPSKDFDSKAINLHIRSPLQDAQRVLAIVSVDLENSLPSLEPVFKQLPKQDESPDNPKTPSATERTEYSVSTQEVPGLTDRPAAPALTASNPQSPSIAFTMNLADLQDVLKTLRKIAGPPDGLMGEILVRTLPKNRVQFGRVHAQSWNENGLLVDKVVADSQEGCVAPMLSEIYDPIMRLMGGENTECEINGFREGAKSSRKSGILTIKFKGTELQLSFPTYKPDRIVRWFDAHRPPAPLISLEDSSELVKSLNKILVCIEPNHPRQAMTVVNFKTDGSYLRLVGSNGAKLQEIGWSHNGESGQKIERILPYNYAHSLKQIMRKVKGPVAICLSDKGIFFQTDGLLLVGKFWTHEKYPDYEALFAAGSDSFVLPVSDLREISASMSEYADQIDNSRMTLSTSQDRVEFKSDGKAVEKSAHQMQGKMVVDINAKFLADLVKHMDGEMVEIRYVDDKCITFHPNTGRERAFLSSLRRREPEKPPEKVQKNKATGTPE